MRRTTLPLIVGLAVAGCTPAPVPVAPPTVTMPAHTTVATARLPVSVPEAPMPLAEAVARAKDNVGKWEGAPKYEPAKLEAFLEHTFPERKEMGRILAALVKSCTDAKGREAEPCKVVQEGSSDEAKLVVPMIEIVGEAAPIGAGATDEIRVLVQLSQRGLSRADTAIERILERRFAATKPVCTAPSATEVADASASLDDFLVIEGRGSARKPTQAERDDLAYFYAAIAKNGPAVGSSEVVAGNKLPADHPDLDARTKMREEMDAALLDGDIARHAKAAKGYLTSLGYPGALRSGEERDQRWGGAAFSFVMRDLARSLEILGEHAEAEQLYRRANPGGGACGTSTHTRFDAQNEGAIRTGHQRGGCGAVVAEHLFSVWYDPRELYGTTLLTRGGFDIARLYRGALLTTGRSDKATVDKALQTSTHAAEGVARLERLGIENWAERVRAVRGFADTSRRDGVESLAALASTGSTGDRIEALSAIGSLAEDRGFDPCPKNGTRHGWGRGGNGERRVHPVMDDCNTRIDDKTVIKVVTSITTLQNDPNPDVREALAQTLGRMASPKARTTLRKLAKDKFENGTVCITKGDAPEVCGKNFPVARAAVDALEEIDEAEKNRRAWR
ncbi:MAG: HEAT repeat domain-containing protein [Polyangiaceae bacterium]|nr:HEAT repeat domain-containing protein [Polyangiaceae bacterium]